MKLKKKFTIVFIASLMVGVGTVYGYQMINNSGKTIIQQQAIYGKMDKNTMIADSHVIVKAKVVGKNVHNDYRGIPVTDWTLKTLEIYEGSPNQTFKIRTRQGENEDIKVVPDEHAAVLEEGETAVFFLNGEKGERPDKDQFDYFCVGRIQGKYKEEKHPEGSKQKI